MSVTDDEDDPDLWLNNDAFVRFLDREDRVRLSRLIIEGLEVALHLCNAFLSTFGPMRLIDILEQILPTAYVVNTSYWPLYRTDSGQSACVCSMFKMSCPHLPNGLSWVHLERPVNETVIFKNENETITLTDLSVIINKFTEKQLFIDSDHCARYRLKNTYEIELEFKAKSSWKDRVGELSDPIKIRLWFKLAKVKSNYGQFCLWMVPHPIFTPIYGRHFTCLLDNLVSLTYPHSLLVTWYNCPKHTIIITDRVFSKYFEKLTLQDVGLEDDRRQRA